MSDGTESETEAATIEGRSTDAPGYDEHSIPARTASQGGRAVVEKYGSEHMAELGRKGSKAVRRKYGLRFYSEIAARNKGVKKRRGDENAAA